MCVAERDRERRKERRTDREREGGVDFVHISPLSGVFLPQSRELIEWRRETREESAVRMRQ